MWCLALEFCSQRRAPSAADSPCTLVPSSPATLPATPILLEHPWIKPIPVFFKHQPKLYQVFPQCTSARALFTIQSLPCVACSVEIRSKPFLLHFYFVWFGFIKLSPWVTLDLRLSTLFLLTKFHETPTNPFRLVSSSHESLFFVKQLSDAFCGAPALGRD